MAFILILFVFILKNVLILLGFLKLLSSLAINIDGFFKLQKVNVLSDDQWPVILAEYIRHNDETIIKSTEKILATYREELLPCASFDEFCDVVGKLKKKFCISKFI